MNSLTQKEDDFTQFLIDNYEDITEREMYLIGFGYTLKRAEEKAREVEECMMDRWTASEYN